jgi:hypothetical protein
MSSTTRLCRCAFFVLAIFVFVGARSRLTLAAMLGNCDEVCTGDTDCNTECLYDYDSEETCGDWGTCAPDCSDICGSTTACDQGCTGDFGDCGGYNGGKSNGECYGYCGDGVCEMHEENPTNCPEDCKPVGSTCGTETCTEDSGCTDVSGGACNGDCCAYPGQGGGGGGGGSCGEYGAACSSDSDCCQAYYSEMCASLNGSFTFCMDTGYTNAPLH